MLEMFDLSFMVYAFLACLVMGMLLSYLGIHVVGRGIVFVDLALGQISSLGVALTDVLHYGETWLPIIFTLLFTYVFGGAISGDVKSYLPVIIPGIMVQTVILTSIVTGTQYPEHYVQVIRKAGLLEEETCGKWTYFRIRRTFLPPLKSVIRSVADSGISTRWSPAA